MEEADRHCSVRALKLHGIITEAFYVPASEMEAAACAEDSTENCSSGGFGRTVYSGGDRNHYVGGHLISKIREPTEQMLFNHRTIYDTR